MSSPFILIYKLQNCYSQGHYFNPLIIFACDTSPKPLAQNKLFKTFFTFEISFINSSNLKKKKILWIFFIINHYIGIYIILWEF